MAWRIEKRAIPGKAPCLKYIVYMRLNFLSELVGLILPPRGTQRLSDALTLDDLLTLQTASGLPYSHESVRALVWELKYYANTRAAALAGELLAEELLAIASEELGKPLLIPVPMHKRRLRERGHNQTEVLCKSALSHLGGSLDYAPIALARTRATPEQQKLSRQERLTNLKHSMEADPTTVKGRVCVVVDDVTTTGATLAEAKRALLAAGAAKVHTVALAQS